MAADKDTPKDWAQGYADGTRRMLGCAVGDLEVLRGRKEAILYSLRIIDEKILSKEQKD